jgi:hypothetical protein
MELCEHKYSIADKLLCTKAGDISWNFEKNRWGSKKISYLFMLYLYYFSPMPGPRLKQPTLLERSKLYVASMQSSFSGVSDYSETVLRILGMFKLLICGVRLPGVGRQS